jgi:PAS domain-containing protein
MLRKKKSGNNERTLLRAVFDALPSLIFVVDRDVQIQEYNAAAAGLIKAGREAVLRRRAGDILHCIHSEETPEGCGRSAACKDCIIRSSVVKAFLGNRIVRRKARIEYIQDGKKQEIFSLITTSPFSFEGTLHALLVIEDISDIAALYQMIFLCPVCGKMQDKQRDWMRVESYFKNNWEIECSHSYCPECFQKERDRFRTENNEEQ